MDSSSDEGSYRSYPEALVDPDDYLDPFDWYREMRADDPVRWDPARRAWDVFRYDDVKEVARDADTFASDPRQSNQHDADMDASPMRETMLNADPPRHDRLRGVVTDFFTPDAVRRLEPAIRDRVTVLLDDLAAAGGGDWVADFAERLPVATVADLLGVPETDRDRFRHWTRVVVEIHMNADGGVERAREARARHRDTMEAMTSYFADLLAERRENPRDDLLTRVATGGPDGRGFDAREMLGFCMLMMFGGTITTTSLLGNALWTLGERPDLRRAYEAGDRSVSGLVEETLRFRSPLQGISRFPQEDVEFRGHEFGAGETVVFWLGAANRDERVFDAPDEFRPGRSPNEHLAFGSGVHYCLGAPLARLEAEVALAELFDRFSGIAVDTDGLSPTRGAGKLVYGVESLPVTFEHAD